jgi:electron transfer flavoprotein beta subunit
MANMRTLMPTLQRSKPTKLETNTLRYISANLPAQLRTTRVEKNLTPDEIATELAQWIGTES